MRAGNLVHASKVLLVQWRWQWSRSSWAMRLVLGLVLLNLLVALLYVLPLRFRIDDLNLRMEQRQQQMARRMNLPQSLEDADPAERLWNFESGFPQEASIPDALAQINAIVTAGDLRIMEAEYRLLELPNSRLRAYQINMPLRGRYGNILGVCLAMLDQVPNLALNNVTFQRKSVADPQAEATLSMTLFLRRT